MEVLKDMPRPMVLRLREIRAKQLEARNKEAMENHNVQQQQSGGPPQQLPPMDISEEAIEEFMEDAAF
jgi:hypothetical protein